MTLDLTILILFHCVEEALFGFHGWRRRFLSWDDRFNRRKAEDEIFNAGILFLGLLTLLLTAGALPGSQLGNALRAAVIGFVVADAIGSHLLPSLWTLRLGYHHRNYSPGIVTAVLYLLGVFHGLFGAPPFYKMVEWNAWAWTAATLAAAGLAANWAWVALRTPGEEG